MLCKLDAFPFNRAVKLCLFLLLVMLLTAKLELVLNSCQNTCYSDQICSMVTFDRIITLSALLLMVTFSSVSASLLFSFVIIAIIIIFIYYNARTNPCVTIMWNSPELSFFYVNLRGIKYSHSILVCYFCALQNAISNQFQ